MSILDAGEYSDDGFSNDVEPLYDHGVPMICNLIRDTPDNKFYFKYHHSAGDSMSMMNPDDMDSNVVGIASLLFILADLETSLRTPKIQPEIVEKNLRLIDWFVKWILFYTNFVFVKLLQIKTEKNAMNECSN